MDFDVGIVTDLEGVLRSKWSENMTLAIDIPCTYPFAIIHNHLCGGYGNGGGWWGDAEGICGLESMSGMFSLLRITNMLS